MQVRFRHRIGLLVALAAFGLIAATIVTFVLGRRNVRELSGIETRYVPLLELEHELTTTFSKITTALEDAASAAEESRIADADALVQTLKQHLEAGADMIAHNGGDARDLLAGITAYYTVARRVARDMVHGASPAELIAPIEKMRAAQLAFAERLKAATSPDRSRLAAAFAQAREAQREALIGYMIIAAAMLMLMAAVSWRMIRRMNRSLQEVSDGVERLASGDFAQEIVVASEDEIGDVAREANRTALRLREYRDELEARNAQLARASRYKSEFLANMSHELRTPLNSIMILSQVLSENDGKNLTPKQIEFATLIHRSGDELLGLINEVLDLAKIEAGKQTVEPTTVALSDIRDYMQRMFAPLAAQRELTFDIQVSDDVPRSVRTDRTRLNQIVKNLVSNAFKFTPRGGVSVRIFRPAQEAYPKVEEPFAISVRDTGIGIPAAKLAQIFEAFTQADSSTSRKYGGTGLGLTIARQLTALLGGELAVESSQTSGSTFTLVLPVGGPSNGNGVVVEPAPAIASAPVAEPVTDARLPGRKVLLVDDDMRNVYSLSSSLREREVTVTTAADGNEALDVLARTRDFDVILLDLRMSGIDGYETLRRMRADEQLRGLPVIVLTANETPEERARCLAEGAVDCIAKPVDIAKLFAALRGAIKTPVPSDPAA